MHFITSAVILMGLLSICLAKPTFDVIADIIHDLVHEQNQPADYVDPYYTQSGSYPQHGAYNRPNVPQGSHHPYNVPHAHGSYAQPTGYHTSSYIQYSPNSYGAGAGSYGQPDSVYDRQGYYQGPPYRQNANGYIQNNDGYHHPPQYGYKNRGY